MSNTYMFFSKLVQLDGELREVLKLRRENLYTETDKVEVVAYVNQTREKSHSGTAEWAPNSSET